MDSHSFFGGLIISVITALLAENFVFARALGVSTMIMAAKNKRNLPGICLGVLYFTLTASWAAWLLSHRAADIQKPFVPLTYVLTIGLIYLITLLLAFIFFKGRFGRIKKYVHISAFNSVIMGTIFLSASGCTAFGEYLHRFVRISAVRAVLGCGLCGSGIYAVGRLRSALFKGRALGVQRLSCGNDIHRHYRHGALRHSGSHSVIYIKVTYKEQRFSAKGNDRNEKKQKNFPSQETLQDKEKK